MLKVEEYYLCTGNRTGDDDVGFIQVIEFSTGRPVDVAVLAGEWRSQTEGRRTAQRSTFTKDREKADTYIQIVEFPSYEEAMANSALPETAKFAERLAELCDGPMVFRNLDVRVVEEM